MLNLVACEPGLPILLLTLPIWLNWLKNKIKKKPACKLFNRLKNCVNYLIYSSDGNW